MANLNLEQYCNLYFPNSNENPALILVTLLLNETNYYSWSRAMKLVLDSKNKLSFIDPSLPQPASGDPMYHPWKRCNTMILSWIQHSVEESIVKSILWMNSAAEVWKDLQERFYQGDMFRIAELLEDFYHLNQNNLTISEIYTQLKSIWEEIEECAYPKLYQSGKSTRMVNHTTGFALDKEGDDSHDLQQPQSTQGKNRTFIEEEV
ncbi:PREDICTED: uncharacterized protein LOC109340003 [Lupinus angustifolius]|uniref:uncharacterized protein LOC109340003 n=1 Tax=Lupinus angustifolius TaxID=3871 RepID=UPI00092E36F8|nr:PREDICTED: uncharacterized protein LOC109340003 [Lupinus angustifolius]